MRTTTDHAADLIAAQEKLSDRQARQEFMTAANKIYKSAKMSEVEKLEALLAMGSTEATIYKRLTPDFAGRIGYPTYELTNNGAEIRRLKLRVDDLAKRAAVQATGENKEETTADGVTIVENVELDRLQLFYPGKPDGRRIIDLKSRGWHWSPTNQAWQRQLTDAARWSLVHMGLKKWEDYQQTA